jgi:hypothetical protein
VGLCSSHRCQRSCRPRTAPKVGSSFRLSFNAGPMHPGESRQEHVPHSASMVRSVVGHNYRTEGKVVSVLNQAPLHEDVWGSGGVGTRILDLGTRWRWVATYGPGSFTLGKTPRPPLDMKTGWAPEPVWTVSSSPCRESNSCRWNEL